MITSILFGQSDAENIEKTDKPAAKKAKLSKLPKKKVVAVKDKTSDSEDSEGEIEAAENQYLTTWGKELQKENGGSDSSDDDDEKPPVSKKAKKLNKKLNVPKESAKPKKVSVTK